MDLLPTIVGGLGMGSVYALMALGFHVTYAVSGTLNFAQGSAAMLGAVFAFALAQGLGWPLAAACLAAVGLCALYGLVVERVAVRPFVERSSDAWLVATVALGILVDNLVLASFGSEPRSLPSPLAQGPLSVGGINLGIYPQQILIIVIGLLLMGGLIAFRRFTRWGLAAAAVSQNIEASRLMGIAPELVRSGAYVVSGLLAGVTGVLLAPMVSIQSDMGSLLGLKAFAVAILGGLGSAGGIVAAGLVFGVVEALCIARFGSSSTQVISFSVLILAIAARSNVLRRNDGRV